MKVIIVLLLVFVFSLFCYGDEPRAIIAGTNIEMDLSGLLQWDRFTNTYYSKGGACNMRIAYERSDLCSCIKKYRPKLMPTKNFMVDEERFLDSDKYLLVFHSVNLESMKDFVLFIGNNDETVLLISEVNVKLFPDFVGKVLEKYRVSRQISTPVDPENAMFINVNIPNGYLLSSSWGNRFTFSRKDPELEDASSIIFAGSFFKIRASLEKVLSADLSKDAIIIENGEIPAVPRKYKTWKIIFQDKGVGSYRCQYAILDDDRLLRIDAVFIGPHAKGDMEQIEKVAENVAFIPK